MFFSGTARMILCGSILNSNLYRDEWLAFTIDTEVLTCFCFKVRCLCLEEIEEIPVSTRKHALMGRLKTAPIFVFGNFSFEDKNC